MEISDQTTSTTNPARWPEPVLVRLDALFDALTFPTPTSFRFADDPAIEVAGTADRAVPDRLVDALWPILYEQGYSRIYRRSGPTAALKPSQPDREFLARLSAAHTSRPHWDPAWIVEWVGNDGSIRARKGETSRFAPPGQYAFGGDPNRPPRPGEIVDLQALRESLLAQPGFYFAYGETLGCDFDSGRMTRIYFHATADGMPPLLASLGTLFNRYEVPFLLKCRDDPAHYDRSDVAVLLVAARFLTIVCRLLKEIDEPLGRHLRPGSPLFTRELRPGVGFADNPNFHESFGQSRCVMVARGLVDAHLAGYRGREPQHRAVSEQFARASLDPARPHLNPGSTDPYRWPEENHRPWNSVVINRTPEWPGSTPFLEAADRIGRRLCRDALWAGDRCNWMTWTTEEIAGRPTPVHRAAPLSLEDGVAGIALFLARLWKFTGNRQQEIALGGAIRQLRSAANNPPGDGFGRDRLGVGDALVALGEWLDDEGLVREGIAVKAKPEWSGSRPSGFEGDSMKPTTPPRTNTRSLGLWPFGLQELPGDIGSLDDKIQAAISALESFEVSDLSLARGRMGDLDFLLLAADKRDRPELRAIAERFGRWAAESFDQTRIPRPCGIPAAGETPDLMFGTAGIGWTFLRLHDPVAVPSLWLGSLFDSEKTARSLEF